MKTEQKLVRIKEIYKIEDFKIYCRFSNNEFRFIDFRKLFNQWDIKTKDIEYPLLNKIEFQKVKLSNGTLIWENISTTLIDENNYEVEHPYDIDPVVLYKNSALDYDLIIENLGILIKNEREKSKMSLKELARKSGVSEEYISKLETKKSNIELLIIRDLIKKGFGKIIKISIE